MTLYTKSGFDSFGAGLQTSTISTDSVEKRTATVDAVLALSRALKSAARGIKPGLTFIDEFAYINTEPSRNERFVHSSVDRTSWSDYAIEPTIHVVDRNELDKALSCEPTVQPSISVRNNFEVEIDWDAVSQLNQGDDEDWSMAEDCEEDDDGGEYTLLHDRMNGLEGMMSAMNSMITTLCDELATERNKREFLAYQARTLEAKVYGLEARLSLVEHDGNVQCARVNDARESVSAVSDRLDTLVAETRAKVSRACQERTDTLTAPTRASVWESVCEHPPVRDKILSEGDCSSWELRSGDSIIRGVKMPLAPKSSIYYDPSSRECSIVVGTQRTTVGGMSSSLLDIQDYQPAGWDFR